MNCTRSLQSAYMIRAMARRFKCRYEFKFQWPDYRFVLLKLKSGFSSAEILLDSEMYSKHIISIRESNSNIKCVNY